MIKEYKRSNSQVLAFEFSGRLDESDYPPMTQVIDNAIAEHGRVRVLLRFHDFSGWTPAGFWRDFRFSREHANSIERLAVVGEASWQETLVDLGKVLLNAEVRYYPDTEQDNAWAWLEND